MVWSLRSGLLAVSICLLAAPVAAAGEGFVISPAFQSVALQSGQLSGDYVLQLSNRTAADQNFKLTAVDFGSLDESGGVAFLGAPTSELEHRYGLAAWMGLGADKVYVARGQSVKIPVSIQNRPSLAPGGHYGAILATAVSDTGATGGNDPRVSFTQVLSSLVLLTKGGGINASIVVRSVVLDHTGMRLPGNVTLRFQNDGNVHLVPRGTVTIIDPVGRVIRRGALNDGSTAILPESFRKYPTPLTNISAAWLPGRYTVRTLYRYDGTDATKRFDVSFWFAGLAVVWIVGLAGVAVIGLFAARLWRRRHA